MTTIDTTSCGTSAFTTEVYRENVSLNESAFGDWLTRGWADAIDELLRIRNLEDDWDGEGTKAPSPDLVDGAIRLAQYLESEIHPAPDRIVAGVNGTIFFECFLPGEYREFEIVSPYEVEMRTVREGSNEPILVSLYRRD